MANEEQGASVKWPESWWGKLALGVAGAVLAALITWSVERHYDKPATPPTAIEKSKPQLQPQPAQLEPQTPSEAKRQTKAKIAAPKSIVRTSGSNSPAVGSITQGAGSALSIGQSGGIGPPLGHAAHTRGAGLREASESECRKERTTKSPIPRTAWL